MGYGGQAMAGHSSPGSIVLSVFVCVLATVACSAGSRELIKDQFRQKDESDPPLGPALLASTANQWSCTVKSRECFLEFR
jgi:hypothetical protein